MRLVKLDNLNEMWELKKSYGENFIGVLNAHLFYVINNGNIVEIDREKVAKMLKMDGWDQLRLLVAAMYMEKYDEENDEENDEEYVADEEHDEENVVEWKNIKEYVADEENESVN